VFTYLWGADAIYDEKGKITLTHPDYQFIQSMWDFIKDQGKVLADFTHKCRAKFWLRCPGCIHGCGRAPREGSCGLCIDLK